MDLFLGVPSGKKATVIRKIRFNDWNRKNIARMSWLSIM
jgi:hypothetical protein